VSAPATATFTERGPRPSNQDAVVAATLPDGREVVAVADGMGGHAGGEVASATALATLLDALRAGSGLERACHAADAAVRAAAAGDPSLEGMGTTLVAVLRSGERYWVANVGDSRAYRVSADGIAQVTHDHSFAAEAIRSGQMSAEEAARSPWKNALTRALGTEGPLEVDVFGPFAADPPHALVLCSDGVHGALDGEAMRRCVLDAADPASAAERLSALALEAGSRDNVTVALRDFGLLLPRERRAATRAEPPPGRRHPAPSRWEALVRRLPGEQLAFAACCGALVLWLAFFLASF
jgi:serine/threonine protein phosphatase PrpC